MIHPIEIKLSPAEAADEEIIKTRSIAASRVRLTDVTEVRTVRRSIDARGRQPLVLVRTEVYEKETFTPEPALLSSFKSVENGKRVLIVGAGSAGYFAALECIELGLKPIVIDRGKDVRARRRDLRDIQQFGIVHPHSNYCFGEGGAGTYSDGKLYTRSHKRGNIEKSLRLFVEHGAKSDILIEAHPHIGSNKLPNIVANMRETIQHYGGEVHFNSYVTDFILQNKAIKGIVMNDAQEIFGEAVILATGHSARDIYYLLHRKGIKIEAKPFALGVRVEHPQSFIDAVQYGQPKRDAHLPAASYSLACQVAGRGVFSFCMCPGGLVVPAATAPGEIVVNGMSMSRRDSEYANSGTVVSVEMEDLLPFAKHDVFATLEFQKHVEQTLFQYGDGSQKAPSQRMTDFVHRKNSTTLPSASYIPGLYSAPLHELLPKGIYTRLRDGMLQFGKMMRGYMTEDANVIGIESRTSAPVRVPRDTKTLMHQDIEGLFPCGEGAGYAGGIISAAMDGQNVAKAVHRWLE